MLQEKGKENQITKEIVGNLMNTLSLNPGQMAFGSKCNHPHFIDVDGNSESDIDT